MKKIFSLIAASAAAFLACYSAHASFPATVKVVTQNTEVISTKWTPIQLGLWPGKDGQICSGTADVKGLALNVFCLEQQSAYASFAILNGLKVNNGGQLGLVTVTEQNDGVALGALVSAAAVNEFFQMGVICTESGPKRQDAAGGVQFGVLNYGNGVQFGLININPQGFSPWFPLVNWTVESKKIETPKQAVERLKVTNNHFVEKLSEYITRDFPRWTKEERLEFIIGAFALTDAHSTEMLFEAATKYKLLKDLKEYAILNKDNKIRNVLNSYLAQEFWEYEVLVSLEGNLDFYIREKSTDVTHIFHTNIKHDSNVKWIVTWQNSDLVLQKGNEKITFRYNDRYAVWYECTDANHAYEKASANYESSCPGKALISISFDKEGKKVRQYGKYTLKPELRKMKLTGVNESDFTITELNAK